MRLLRLLFLKSLIIFAYKNRKKTFFPQGNKLFFKESKKVLLNKVFDKYCVEKVNGTQEIS